MMPIFESRIIKPKRVSPVIGFKKMMVYAPENIITGVKLRAMYKEVSMSRWILEAITEKIARDNGKGLKWT